METQREDQAVQTAATTLGRRLGLSSEEVLDLLAERRLETTAAEKPFPAIGVFQAKDRTGFSAIPDKLQELLERLSGLDDQLGTFVTFIRGPSTDLCAPSMISDGPPAAGFIEQQVDALDRLLAIVGSIQASMSRLREL